MYDYLISGKSPGADKQPLLIYLHGMGERHNRLLLEEKHSLIYGFISENDYPFVLVSPHSVGDNWWDPRELSEFAEYMLKEYSGGGKRVYIIGFSMGGSGAWSMVNYNPEIAAAFVVISSFFTPLEPTRCKGIPVWAFHGKDDTIIPCSDTVRMGNWINENGGNVRVTLLDGMRHNCDRFLYRKKEIYDWFLSFPCF